MNDSALPSFQASFSAVDPRFVEIDGVRYATLHKDYLDGTAYEEVLGDFGGLRDAFLKSAETHGMAVLLRSSRGEWEMIGLYEISALQTYDEPFECRLGERVAKLTEI